MPLTNLGLNATHGEETWANFILDRLAAESVLLESGARRIPITGEVAHIPRVATDGTASFVGELVEIPSSAPTGDEIVLTPRKIANVVTLSNESLSDAPVDELNVVGDSLTRAIAAAIDARVFSASIATAVAPAGLLSAAYTLPTQTGGVGSLDSFIRAIGTIEAAGGVARAIFANPADVTTLRLIKQATGSNMPALQPDPTKPGASAIAGARLYPTPAIAAGTALVADTSQIVVGIRQDAEVSFSEHAAYTADAVVARVVARADWALNDLNGIVKVTV